METASKKFLFVGVAQTGKIPPSKDLRTTIQKHVMNNIILTRQTKTRGHKLESTSNSVPACQKSDRVWQALCDNDDHISMRDDEPSLERWFIGSQRSNPFANYPIEMTRDSLMLIDHVYTSSHPYITPFRESWLPLSLGDTACFHEILSNVALHVATLQPSVKYYQQAVRHHAQAVESVNRRLLDPVQGISDGIVQTIMAFACFSHNTRNWHAYNTHMAGLQTIIRLRGGVHSIDHNRILRLLLSGIDVASSCFQNQATHFPIPSMVLSSLQPSFIDGHPTELPWPLTAPSISFLWQEVFPPHLDPAAGDHGVAGERSSELLSSIFTDLSTVIMLIKSATSKLSSGQFWNSSTFVIQNINPLTYRLLASSIREVDINEENYMNECCRLAALILLSKIRRKFKNTPISDADCVHGSRIIHTGIEMRSLHKILTIYISRWTSFRPLLLWALVLGALESVLNMGPTWKPIKVNRRCEGQRVRHDINHFREMSSTNLLLAHSTNTQYPTFTVYNGIEAEDERGWWIASIVRTAKAMGIDGGKECWTDILALAGNLIWVKEVLDEETYLLGQEVMDKFQIVAVSKADSV